MGARHRLATTTKEIDIMSFTNQTSTQPPTVFGGTNWPKAAKVLLVIALAAVLSAIAVGFALGSVVGAIGVGALVGFVCVMTYLQEHWPYLPATVRTERV